MSDHAFFICLYNHYTWPAGESLWIQESLLVCLGQCWSSFGAPLPVSQSLMAKK